MTVPNQVQRRVVASQCPLDCPDSCSLDVTLEHGRVVALEGNERNPTTAGFICDKVRAFPRYLEHETRLRHPMIRTGAKGAGEFRQASWDEALERIVAELTTARESAGGESILPLSYGGSNGSLTQDTADLALFRRLGASHLLRTVCAAPTGHAAQGLYGRMPGVAYADYEAAELIVVWGANSQASGIHLVPHIKRARARGTKLVVVDPRRTKLARQADLHLAPRPGTDLPLALAVARWLFENGRADVAFLTEHAAEVELFRERAEPWSLVRAAAECGLAPTDIEAFARTYADASPAVVRCGWGLERNRNGCAAVASVLALPAVAGKFGLRGGGYTLSNGAAFELGAAVDEQPSTTRMINMNQVGRILDDPPSPPIRVLFVYNNNPLATLPDQERLRRGLAREELFTVVFDQVHTDTVDYADVVLPATTFLEHAELRAGYGSYALQASEPVIAPVGEARPNYAVFGELVRKLGLERPGDDFEPAALTARILAGAAPAVRTAVERDGIAFPTFGTSPVQFVDVRPRTRDGKVHLVPDRLEREAAGGFYAYRSDPATDAHPLALISPATKTTISSTFGQFFEGPMPLALHPDDAAARGIADGDRVRAYNELGELVTIAKLDADLRPGVALFPKGVWCKQTENGRTSNALVPDSLSDVGGGACFNDARIEVEKLR